MRKRDGEQDGKKAGCALGNSGVALRRRQCNKDATTAAAARKRSARATRTTTTV